ncbi:MAG TPA: DUF805 domain-containing protein [Caulobacteraceae bacterium]
MQPAQTFGKRGVVAASPPQQAFGPTPHQASPAQPSPQSSLLGQAPGRERAYAPLPTAESLGFKASAGASPSTSSLWTMLFSLNGRLAPGPYRLIRFASSVIFLSIFWGVLKMVLQQKGPGGDIGGMLMLLLVDLVALGLWFWTTLATQVKRWHDRGKSGVWMLVGFIPLIGPLWTLVELMFLNGEPGPNQFGPSPRGGVAAATVFET